MAPRTLAQKLWDDHLVARGAEGEPDLLYIDLHLVHEVTSPQAFARDQMGFSLPLRGCLVPVIQLAPSSTYLPANCLPLILPPKAFEVSMSAKSIPCFYSVYAHLRPARPPPMMMTTRGFL